MSFSFLSMVDTYEARKIAKDIFEINTTEICVSTALVTDSNDPYETCIFFGDDDGGKVVETYKSVENAKSGHQKWVSFIKANKITNLDKYKDQGTNIWNIIVQALNEE